VTEPGDQTPTTPHGGDYAPSVAERLALYQRAGGVIVPLLTTVVAFLIGGLIVLATGNDPINAYIGIFKGAGLNWFFPWIDEATRAEAEFNLQQTLLGYVTPLILTGLAVAFAFRCGMFNIGGQGQYIVGAMVSVWVGSSWAGLPGLPHTLLAIGLAMLAGAAWAGIAGLLKATVGAHEVITTIMLNWIAVWVGAFLVGVGGPLQNDEQASVPFSNTIVEGAKLPTLWGDPLLQALHVGVFFAIVALVVYWAVLNRTTLGYGVRAVGFNPEAARYGGIGVRRNYFLAMAISGAFAGLAGATDILGWQFRLARGDIENVTGALAFAGIAVALLGRNTAIGVALAALLFGSLITGTSTRNLDPEVFQPELASNLTLLIQGLVVLFVGADLIILWLLQRVRSRVTA
jgi:simple sugar transport system permease protein